MAETPGSAFGIGPLDTVETHEPSGIFDENDGQAQEKPQQSDPARPAPEPEAPTEAPQGEPSEQSFLGGRYKTQEAFEQGHRELERTFTQTRQDFAELRARQEQQDQVLQAFAPFITERLLEENPELAQQMELQSRIEPLVEERLAPLQQQAQAEREQQQYLSTVSSFYQRHPEIVPNSEIDQQVVAVIGELDLVKEDPEALDVAAEAAQNPALRFVLNAEPHLAETDAGMSMARVRATQLAQQAAPTPQQQGTPQGGPTQRFPFVEHGGSGAPSEGAPGTQPDSPLAGAVKLWQQERGNPFLR